MRQARWDMDVAVGEVLCMVALEVLTSAVRIGPVPRRTRFGHDHGNCTTDSGTISGTIMDAGPWTLGRGYRMIMGTA